MPQVINTNIASLNAQRNLNSSQNALNTSLQRLSSGLRINSARDDAAGLAISERFSSQINGINQAVRNANDGISLSQTAEGDLTQIGNNLQRIRVLAVQSANATNSSTDRQALQNEVTQLTQEIDRVAKTSNFNGTNLLDGSFTSQLFQVGANSNQSIAINSIVDAKAASLGNVSFANASSTLDATASLATSNTAYIFAGGSVIVGTNTIQLDTVQINSTTNASGTQTAIAADINKALMVAINSKIGETGLSAKLDDSNNIVFDSVSANISSIGDPSSGDNAVSFKIGTAFGTKLSDVAAATFSGITATSGAATVSQLSKIDISTGLGARQAMEVADTALTEVNSARAQLGAIQNRFSSVVSSLQISSENLSASRSRIQDTDFAEETANLTRNQILQQAGIAMLAQANSLPNNVLTLLR